VSDSKVNGNGSQGLQEFLDGGIAVSRSSVSGNGSQGAQEFDAGGLAVSDSKVNGNDFQGLQEFSGGGLAVTRSRVSGNGSQGVQEFDAGGARIAHSRVNNNNFEGIQEFSDGDLFVSRSAVANNGDEGMQEFDAGDLRLTRSRVTGSGLEGVDEATPGDAFLSKSTVSGNEGGGLLLGSGTLNSRVTNSTISGNSTTNDGGGILNHGTLTLVNSTIANNHADGSGGGLATNGSGATASLNGVTVARNVADADTGGGDFGGGLFQGSTTTISARNSLIALNRVNFSGATGPDCYNESTDFDSGGHNLLTDDNGCTGFNGPGDLVRSNPKIGALADNGGPTKTIALKSGSPALDHAGPSAPNRDQRGVKRGNHPDIGAFERR
jgi:hypothetical protein